VISSEGNIVHPKGAYRTMFVPVVDQNQRPLMPTTPARAKRWIKNGKATHFWKGGIFCVRLNGEPSGRAIQPLAVGIDPGSKREGYSVLSASHTYLNIQAEARMGVKDAEKNSTRMRRTRRQRKTPCRQPRHNRKHSKKKLPPSTRARWAWKLRLARFLCQLFPVSVFVVEDIAARTKKGKRRWNHNFSPLEVGKHWFYEGISKLAPLQIMQGYETKTLRDQLGLKKTSKKLAEVWEAHCVDAWVLAYSAIRGDPTPDNVRLMCLAPFNWHHRQLHRFQPGKGGKRTPYGGTLSQGIKRGTLVKHPRWGKATVGGTMGGKLSLHDPHTNKRLTQSARVTDCQQIKLLRWRTRLVPLARTTASPAPKKERLLPPRSLRRRVSAGRGFMSQKPNPVPPEEKRKRKKKTEHTLTRAVTPIRLSEANPGKLAALDALMAVYLPLCQQYTTCFCTQEDSPDKYTDPLFESELSERLHRVAMQQAAGIAKSWRTNRATAY
jgi:hypothetical protein